MLKVRARYQHVVKVVPINQEMLLLVHGANAQKKEIKKLLPFVVMVSMQMLPETRGQNPAKMTKMRMKKSHVEIKKTSKPKMLSQANGNVKKIKQPIPVVMVTKQEMIRTDSRQESVWMIQLLLVKMVNQFALMEQMVIKMVTVLKMMLQKVTRKHCGAKLKKKEKLSVEQDALILLLQVDSKKVPRQFKNKRTNRK